MEQKIQFIECPRDAMQGWPQLIPTAKKIEYINSLLQVGFHSIDFGSFVSPKAIPQMADTKDVLDGLDLSGSTSKLLAIVANERGAQEAVGFDKITYLGFPFSISETFQQRNTNSSIKESLQRVEAIQKICIQTQKELVVYLSMGFGNPYGDPYTEEILQLWVREMVVRGVGIISLADTVGLATPDQISLALSSLIATYPQAVVGVHLHSTTENWQAKLEAAIGAGCERIDGAIKGIGGCPMAGSALVGNMDTELVLAFLQQKGLAPTLNEAALQKSLSLASEIFV
jgi:hydroxymethylglutaryl-CoA lyase